MRSPVFGGELLRRDNLPRDRAFVCNADFLLEIFALIEDDGVEVNG